MWTQYPIPRRHLPRNPSGWFAVGLCHELQPGAARAVSACGRNPVLFRTESGRVSVLDAYCPHRDKTYHVSQGKHATPSVHVTIHAADWLRLHSGELGSARAYLTGRFKVAGDMKLVRRLAAILPITTPGASP